MEREQKVTKLINVLRRTASSVSNEPSEEVVGQAIGQYNRVYDTLAAMDQDLSTLFVKLSDGATAAEVAAACRQLAAYYRDEISVADTLLDPDSFKEFWKKSAQDLEDLGDFIRGSIERMQEKARKHEASSNGSDD
jgi:hypothetical protein